MQLPKHLAIIMDGNGRWAAHRKRPRTYGHIRGARVARTIAEACASRGVENLTLFAFSTENWFRPQQEVSFLMKLLARQLQRERQRLMENNIHFRIIGELSKVPQDTVKAIEETLKETANNRGMTLTFAISFGGRQQIKHAVQKIARQVAAGNILPEDIDEDLISASLDSGFMPDPDLIIRTSGEFRISNFFLWPAAYSEVIVSPKFWPDFTEKDLDDALELFSARERRYGRVNFLNDSIYQIEINE